MQTQPNMNFSTTYYRPGGIHLQTHDAIVKSEDSPSDVFNMCSCNSTEITGNLISQGNKKLSNTQSADEEEFYHLTKDHEKTQNCNFFNVRKR